MKTLGLKVFILLATGMIWINSFSQELARAPQPKTNTRWVSPENPTGAKGKGGLTNKGAKGNAFFIVPPGEKQVLFDVKGAGIINRMWMSGTIGVSEEQRRAVRIDMFWDGAAKPAVSAPIGDFFGIGHGMITRYDNEIFSSPEARSFNFTIPMPYRKSAYITITNESSKEVWIWYDINYLEVEKIHEDLMYFHAYWNRDLKTKVGYDYVILPEVSGTGRYIGANISVIGDSLYRGSWFGEGEVKIYLDGDRENPTLVGTGTEDYIGSGWGQGEYASRYFGSLVSDREHDIYAFYRYHVADPVYFHQDCRVTIQQMGNNSRDAILKMISSGADLKAVGFLDQTESGAKQGRLLEENGKYKFGDPDFPDTGVNFYRSDDVSATAYFYLDKPESDLPELPPVEIRLKYLNEMVWKYIKK
jgi:hypothetical protein